MRECATTLEAELTDDEMKQLVESVRSSRFTGSHLEIGTAAGGTLCRLLEIYKGRESPSFVVVDPMTYFPNQLDSVKENLRRHRHEPESIEFVVSKSDEAFGLMLTEERNFDFILIDGNHKFRHVTSDLRWSRLLNPGGLLCMHDYHPAFPGVFLAVNRFLRKNRNYEKERHVESMLIIRKKEMGCASEVSARDRVLSLLISPCFQLKASISKRLKRIRRSDGRRLRAAARPGRIR